MYKLCWNETRFKGGQAMTKEQEEAIERLNSLIKINKDFFENQGNMLINKKDIQDIDTVLSMLQEQQEENKKKDKIIDLMSEIFYKRFKAELLLEYGFESEEQLKQYFKSEAEKEYRR